MAKIINIVWKSLGGRVWLIVTCALIVLILAVNIVATQVGLIFGTINLVFGGYRYKEAEGVRAPEYKSAYASKEESAAAIRRLSEDIVAEGIVLLKNEEISAGGPKSLPLKKGTPEAPVRISVFGKNSVKMVYGGSGSGGRSADSVVNLYSALENAGFVYNGRLKEFYDTAAGGRPDKAPAMGTILSGYEIYETPLKEYPQGITDAYAGFSEAALIVLTRIGGEGYDLPRTMKESWDKGAKPLNGARSGDDHYLQLDKNETDLINHVCRFFDNVIVLINSGTAMELGFLDDPDHYAYNPKIKGALWIGNPGGQGNTAVAKVLCGDVNPSGRLVDTYPRDFKKDPAWSNFGNNLQKDGNKYFYNVWGSPGAPGGAYFCLYEEGIYVGYRYYETRAFEEKRMDSGSTWWEDNVVFPFGYGLSYTGFEWEITGASENAEALDKDGSISVTVKVTNTGDTAGKDVVQLYYSAPYYGGGIEKAHIVLGDFEKTGVIQPGSSAAVTLTLKVSDMASYDYNDADGNGFTGYELEEGSYKILIGRDAHDAWTNGDSLQRTYRVPLNGYQYDKDTATGKEVKNRFDQVSNHLKENRRRYLSRDDWELTWPKGPISENTNRSYNVVKNIAFFDAFNEHAVTPGYDKPDSPWYKTAPPAYGKAGSVKLTDLIGKPYDDPEWDKLLDQLTIREMSDLIGIGAFGTQFLPKIGKPPTKDFDGPGGFVVGSFMSASGSRTEVCFFPCESLIASAWSKELAKKMGEAIGEEGIWGGQMNGLQFTFSGWYAPAVNIHRSQFGGRNFEYYSEDGILSGKLAAEVCKGTMSKGTYPYVKHFAFNDMETNRSDNGIAVWLSEQSMRELYLKPFELAVKEGKTTAMMSSFNRIGTEWAGASYALLTEILRVEWGFRGMVITDYNNGKGKYMDLDRMIRAGGDLNLFQSGWLSTSKKALTPTHLHAMRNAAHNILFTVAGSNAMNIAVGRQMMPVWVIVMISVDIALLAGASAWGFFAVRKALRKESAETINGAKA